MSTVYKGYDSMLQREVAVKVLNFEAGRDERTLARFLREAKLHATLDHPNIVKMLSYGQTDEGKLFLVMECLDANPLSQEIGNGQRLNLALFFSLFLQVLDAIEWAHGKGIIHRDLKPSNILVSKEAGSICAKISDFGIACRPEEQDAPGAALTKTGVPLGSPMYMSPEQCRGNAASASSDIYSIGCVMFEALTGNPPHTGESVMDLIYKHSSVAAPGLAEMVKKPELKNLGLLIDSCLQKEPELRPGSAKLLKEELKQAGDKCRDFCKDASPTYFTRSRQPLAAGGIAKLAIAAISVLVVSLIALGAYQRSSSSRSAAPLNLRADLDARKKHAQESLKNAIDRERKKLLRGDSPAATADNLYEMLSDLARSNEKFNDFPEAVKDYDEAIAVSEQTAVPLSRKTNASIGKAGAELELGNLPEVEKILQSLSVLPDYDKDSGSRFVRARLFIRRHSFSLAARELNQGVAIAETAQIKKVQRRSYEPGDVWETGALRIGIHQDSSIEQLDKIRKDFQAEHCRDSAEQFEALELCGSFLKYYLAHRSDHGEELITRAQKLITAIKADSPGGGIELARMERLIKTYQSEISSFE